MRFRQRKGHAEPVSEDEGLQMSRDERALYASSATLNNVGPQHAGRPDDEDMDVTTGTTSGLGSARRGLRGKPARGSREDPRF